MNTPDSVSPRDMLDIIFANRNRTYGANPMHWGTLLIGFFIMLPHLITAQTAVPPIDTIDIVDTNGKAQEGEADEPPVLEEQIIYCYGATTPAVKDDTYQLYDIQKPPTFPGGEQELRKFLTENTQYPTLARENNIQGMVALSFVIGQDGQISDVTVLRDIGGGCSNEAIRVVSSMPKWNPGEVNGNPVKVRFILPVRFKP